jgi:hypothetical protein
LFRVVLSEPWHNIGLHFITGILEKAEVFFFDRSKIWLNARVERAHEDLGRLLCFTEIFHNIGGFTGTRYRRWWHRRFGLEELSYLGNGKVGARWWL